MGAMCSAPDKGNTPVVDLPNQDTRRKLLRCYWTTLTNSSVLVKEEIIKFEKELETNELKGFQIN